jgi:multiple sugar transport system ATP-binding protein
MSDLKVEALSKRFGNVLAVDDVSFSVSSGELVAILGASGSGKTSILRCIAGLENPDSGNIFLGGRRINDIPPKDRDIAMVFQNYALYSHMLVFRNIAFPLEMQKLPKHQIETRVNNVASLLKIGHLLSRKPSQLSGGEQQRVALGRAIIREPKLFLWDEPLSNLDAKLRTYMRVELRRLQRDLNVTTIYVTHDQSEAMALADRVVVLNEGKVTQYDSPRTVYDQPANVFVAEFLGNPPMNLIRGHIVRGREILFSSGILSCQLPDQYSGSIKEAWDKEVIMGVRPEDLYVSKNEDTNCVASGEVYVVEQLGSLTEIDVRVGDQILKSLTPKPSVSYEIGARVCVGLFPEKIRMFDAETGAAL